MLAEKWNVPIQLLISDANILIDMEVGGLIEAMFRLPEKFAFPNILYEEELLDRHAELPGFGLQVLEINEEYVKESYRLRVLYRKPSQNDLFALALAKQEACPLVTGDKDLREVADFETVVVSGTLWLIERLIEDSMISVEAAQNAYDKMKDEGRRLPWPHVRKQLKRLKSEK